MSLLRQINRAVSKKIESVIHKSLNQHDQDINAGRQKLALKETVQYISEKMDDIQSFPNKEAVMEYAVKACKTEGLILEFGVFSGYTINRISNYFKNQTVYGFDSFEGLPKDWRDGYPTGKFRVKRLPAVNSNVKLIKGWFDETLPLFTKENPGDVAFLHVDCDLYSSTKTIFSLLKNRIKTGTIIVFDEYFNYPGWKKGEFKAFQEFIAENNISYKYLTYNNKHEQVALIIT